MRLLCLLSLGLAVASARHIPRLNSPVLRLHGGQQFGDWTQHVTADGTPYYYNTATGESAWTLPAAPPPPPVAAAAVWTAHTTGDGQTYYFNTATGESAWTLPPGEQLAPADMGAPTSDDVAYDAAAAGSAEPYSGGGGAAVDTNGDAADTFSGASEAYAGGSDANSASGAESVGVNGGSEGAWVKYETDDGLPYYFNCATGVTSWELPEGAVVSEEGAPPATPEAELEAAVEVAEEEAAEAVEEATSPDAAEATEEEDAPSAEEEDGAAASDDTSGWPLAADLAEEAAMDEEVAAEEAAEEAAAEEAAAVAAEEEVPMGWPSTVASVDDDGSGAEVAAEAAGFGSYDAGTANEQQQQYDDAPASQPNEAEVPVEEAEAPVEEAAEAAEEFSLPGGAVEDDQAALGLPAERKAASEDEPFDESASSGVSPPEAQTDVEQSDGTGADTSESTRSAGVTGGVVDEAVGGVIEKPANESNKRTKKRKAAAAATAVAAGSGGSWLQVCALTRSPAFFDCRCPLLTWLHIGCTHSAQWLFPWCFPRAVGGDGASNGASRRLAKDLSAAMAEVRRSPLISLDDSTFCWPF